MVLGTACVQREGEPALLESGRAAARPGHAASVAERGYFHCVETPNPTAMKPKPATMFQFPIALIGRSPSVT